MNPRPLSLLLILFVLSLTSPITAQINSICAEVGIVPGLDSPFAHVPYVYGQVKLRGLDPKKKAPAATVILQDGLQSPNRFLVSKGSYCFRRKSTTSTLIVEIDGIEAARRTLPSFGEAQHREDFEINVADPGRSSPPSVISSKYTRLPNPKTDDIYKRAEEAETANSPSVALKAYQAVVELDPGDHVSWWKIGSLYSGQGKYAEADAAFRKSLELNVDYTPAWIKVGQLRIAQKQFAAAAEIFRFASTLEPRWSLIYRWMAEAYLQAKQGTLGVEALNKAIELDPIGQAECHLVKAHLYELAGARKLAANEYKAFLNKIPEHKDRKKFEKFIKENPE